MCREIDCGALKRIAQQIAVQLPQDRNEAILVLDYVRELMEWEHGTTGAVILPFVRAVLPGL